MSTRHFITPNHHKIHLIIICASLIFCFCFFLFNKLTLHKLVPLKIGPIYFSAQDIEPIFCMTWLEFFTSQHINCIRLELCMRCACADQGMSAKNWFKMLRLIWQPTYGNRKYYLLGKHDPSCSMVWYCWSLAIQTFIGFCQSFSLDRSIESWILSPISYLSGNHSIYKI